MMYFEVSFVPCRVGAVDCVCCNTATGMLLSVLHRTLNCAISRYELTWRSSQCLAAKCTYSTGRVHSALQQITHDVTEMDYMTCTVHCSWEYPHSIRRSATLYARTCTATTDAA